jgi:EAL domain-containing protein (putative c-di-GMP-specific phosphodiesterase class I)/CheY-like chemotaxis protein
MDNLVLIVDTEEATLAKIRRVAENLECEVLEADGLDAVEKIISLRAPSYAIVAVDSCIRDGSSILRALGVCTFDLNVVLVGDIDWRVMAGVKRIAQKEGLKVIGSIDRNFDGSAVERLLGSCLYANPQVRLDEIEAALEEQQLLLYYQPKVVWRGADMVVSGVEALVRWNHPRYGLLSPRSFLPLIDQSDLLVRLTDFVMATALRQAGVWRQHGLHLEMTVNLSPGLVRDREFPDRLEILLREQGVLPQDVVIDVLENRANEYADLVYEALTRLRLLGVGLCLDNFGTGQSSLTQLLSLPFTEVKLDGYLVTTILQEPKSEEVLKAIVNLIHAMGLTACAEGAESQATINLLRAANFDACQGHAVCAPVPSSDVVKIINSWGQPQTNLRLVQQTGFAN